MNSSFCPPTPSEVEILCLSQYLFRAAFYLTSFSVLKHTSIVYLSSNLSLLALRRYRLCNTLQRAQKMNGYSMSVLHLWAVKASNGHNIIIIIICGANGSNVKADICTYSRSRKYGHTIMALDRVVVSPVNS